MTLRAFPSLARAVVAARDGIVPLHSHGRQYGSVAPATPIPKSPLVRLARPPAPYGNGMTVVISDHGLTIFALSDVAGRAVPGAMYRPQLAGAAHTAPALFRGDG